MLKRALMVTLVAATPTVHAALIDQGDGVIYDDVAGIAWLKDANFAKTSGVSSDGMLSWDAAVAWASNLTFAGYDDWRLASAGTNPCFDCGTSEYSSLYAQGIRLDSPGPFTNLPPIPGYYGAVSYWTGTAASDTAAWAYTLDGPGAWADYLGTVDETVLSYAWAVRDVTPVPEPGSSPLMLAGLAALAHTLRWRTSRCS